jgi:hypothetical protein
MAERDLQYQDERPIFIRPIQGQWGSDPAVSMPTGASPFMRNCSVYQGLLRKRPGFGQHVDGNTSLGNQVLGLFSHKNAAGNTFLVANTKTGFFRFNDSTEVWDTMTGSALTGTDDDLFSYEVSQTDIVFSQGVDRVMLHDLSGTSYAQLSANCPPARRLCRFNNRLNLGWTLESAFQEAYRHRWPINGDHSNWTGVGAGFRDEPEMTKYLHGMLRIGTNAMANYYVDAIEVVTQQPNATAPFVYHLQIPEIGLLAPHTLKGRNNQHFFLAKDDFYMFNGMQVEPIGGPVRDELFYTLAIGNPLVMFSEIMFDTQEYISFLVKGGADYPNEIWVYNYGRNIWYVWTTPAITMRCATKHALFPAVRIDDLIGTMDEQDWQYDAQYLSPNYPALTTGASDGKVYRWSWLYKSDDGEPIHCTWTSQDFTSEMVFDKPGYKIEIARLVIEYRGIGRYCTLDVAFSTDGGNVWEQDASVTLGNEGDGLHTAHVDPRVVGDRIRFKIENNTDDEDFMIAQFKMIMRLHKTPVYADAS